MNIKKNVTTFFIFFSFIFSYSQISKNTLIAEFTYLLKAKLYKSTPNYTHEELFSLQVLDDRAFFISEKAIKFDSIFQIEFQNATAGGNTNINFSGKSFPKTKFPYTIIQSNTNTQYFERIGMTLFSYKEPIIADWKLINESKTIHTFNCKKAEINYKGRDWVAWYTTEIPLPYGPYKFAGLPGLIIQIADKTGDYDFELVKSTSATNLANATLRVSRLRYENNKETTLANVLEAKKNFANNLIGSITSMDTSITTESMQNLRNIQKQKLQNIIDENRIELEP
ncbi:MAG: GLPGLI family protein [Cruoricaptor ignavus]|nr:GLPGLI family protein [Cruoricaptor ignavus]